MEALGVWKILQVQETPPLFAIKIFLVTRGIIIFVESCAMEFLGGWVGGVSGLLVGYPLDTLKVARQLHPEQSAVSALRTIIRTRGALGERLSLSHEVLPFSPYHFRSL